jgi:hypothetical protein
VLLAGFLFIVGNRNVYTILVRISGGKKQLVRHRSRGQRYVYLKIKWDMTWIPFILPGAGKIGEFLGKKNGNGKLGST